MHEARRIAAVAVFRRSDIRCVVGTVRSYWGFAAMGVWALRKVAGAAITPVKSEQSPGGRVPRRRGRDLRRRVTTYNELRAQHPVVYAHRTI